MTTRPVTLRYHPFELDPTRTLNQFLLPIDLSWDSSIHSMGLRSKPWLNCYLSKSLIM